MEDTRLTASIKQINEVPDHAREEGWPAPNQTQVKQAEALLRRMFDAQPHEYWVYPTPDREIVIDAGEDELRVITTLNDKGRIIYTYRRTDTGELCAIRHDNADTAPNTRMKNILKRLGSISA